MEIKASEIRIGDKGYNGDKDGAFIVDFVSSVGVDLHHETGEWDPILKMSHREAAEQDWRWFRD